MNVASTCALAWVCAVGVHASTSAPSTPARPFVAASLSTSASPAASPSARTLDLEFQAVDIHEVFRVLAELGRVNIVADPRIHGEVSARFRGVTWDEALEQVVRAHALCAMRDGNIVYVEPES